MTPGRLSRLTLASIVLLAFAAAPAFGQAKLPKAKAGFPLVGDPADLAKPGTALSPWATVVRPTPLKNVRSWTLETKRHRYLVTHMAARPDGKRFATAGYDGHIRLWDAETGAFDKMLVGHEGAVHNVAWSPDGHYLASAGYYSTRVWDVASGQVVRVLRDPKSTATLVAWSPDGTKLLTGGGGSGFVGVWDVAASKLLANTEYGTAIYSIAWAPNGENVAVAASASGTYIADAFRLKTVHVFKETLDPDLAVGFSPDGKFVAASNTKRISLIDVETGKVDRKIDAPGYTLTWTPKGGLVHAGTGYLVSARNAGFAIGSLADGYATALSLTADGSKLFGLYGNEVTIWDFAKTTVERKVTIGEARTVLAGPAANLVIHDEAGTPSLWDPATCKRVSGLDGHKGAIVAHAWGPTGKTLVVAAADKKVRVFDAATGKLLRTVTAPSNVTALAIAGDGRLAVAASNQKLAIWGPTGEGEPAQTIPGFKNPPSALAWTRDNRIVASADGKNIRVVAAESGKVLKDLEHPRDVYSILWSNDGGRLLVGSSDEFALVGYTGASWKSVTLDRGTVGLSASTLSWSPDGQTLLGHRTSAYQQWNGKTGKLVGPAAGSPGGARTLAYSPDGKTFVASCVDRTARFFDAGPARMRSTLIADKDQVLFVSAEGHYRGSAEPELELVAVVQSDKAQETMSLKDLASKWGFRNNPAAAK